MGADLVKAMSTPIQSAVHDCAQISSESDCQSMCCTCHAKTIGPDEDSRDEHGEIDIENKENG